MTYGSATTAENVAAYLEHIYRGRAPEGLITDFEHRYRLIGRSPLVEITNSQAELLQERLGREYIVRAGMLHSPPFIHDAVLNLKHAGAESIRGIVLSPQFSSSIMGGYLRTLADAAEQHGFPKDAVSIADPWPTEPHFIALLAHRIQSSLRELENRHATRISVLFTTHSLPKRVVDTDPTYLEQLKSTADSVVAEIKPQTIEWHACYQSAGHTPEEWLKPDLTDMLSALHRKGTHSVLIVPLQFLSDHLEILYDLDIAARQQCDERGIAYHRIDLPNTDPFIIEALAAISD